MVLDGFQVEKFFANVFAGSQSCVGFFNFLFAAFELFIFEGAYVADVAVREVEDVLDVSSGLAVVHHADFEIGWRKGHGLRTVNVV